MGTSHVVTLSRAIMSPQRKILDRLTGTRHLVVGKCVFGQELSAAAICRGLLILPNPPQACFSRFRALCVESRNSFLSSADGLGLPSTLLCHNSIGVVL